jgi:divalent metal cation (Fe/Co/Zn/Cd) transporter
MAAEAIHSVVDSLNGLVLLWGMRASRKPPDAELRLDTAKSCISGRSLSPC